MSLYRYKLELEKKGFNSTDDIFLLNGKKTSVIFSNISMELSLYGISFNRKVYEPGNIQAEILVTTKVSDTTNVDVKLITKMLVNRPASLYVEEYHVAEGDKIVVDNSFKVASNYYIHEISPQFEKGTEEREVEKVDVLSGKIEKVKETIDINCIYIKLEIFSLDKLMTLNKYSQAHIGQKLFSGILESNKSSFKLQYETTSQGSTEPKEVTLDTNIRKLSHLVYPGKVILKDTKGNKSLVSATLELIHPYLVQYNETFYDFLRRTANRCGEIFYFENGTLCCGVSTGSTTAFSATEISRIIFQRGAPAPLKIRDYARDTIKGNNYEIGKYEIGKGKILSDPISTGSGGFPTDSFLKPGIDEHPFFYNSELAAEDQYLLLYKDKFARDSVTDLWCGGDGEHVMRTVSVVLNSTSLMEMLTTFGLKELESAAKSAAKAGKATEKGNELLAKEALDPSEDYAVMYSKVDKDTDHWITLKYTKGIKQGELKQSARMICIDMGKGFKNVALGDKISIPNDTENTYVVVRIDMSSENEWQRSYEGFFDDGAAKLKGEYVQRIYAIPMDGDVFFPPLLPDEPFRRSGAQPAFVIDSSDPSGQGRVRIRYPWQPSAKDAKDTFESESKEDDFKDALETLNAKQKKLEDYAKNITRDILGNVTAKQKKDASDKKYQSALEEYKAAWVDYLAKKEVYDAALAKYMITEAATPWIRMASPMATLGGGMFFKPEKGDEVMVDFENGNIERPFVIGTLYSKNTPAPKEGGRVIVSKNGHTIKMNDPTDGTALLAGMLPSVKFLQSYGCLDKNPIDMENGTVKALGGMELTDQFGFYNIRMSSHDRNISISSPFGDVYINALTGITIEAPNGDINITGKNVNISAYNKISINSGKNVKLAHDRWRLGWLSTGFDPEDAGKNVGKAFGKVFSVGKFLDLSLLRTLLEIFVRPVDGTLDIKSGRFLLLQAGNTTAAGEFANYNVKKFDDWKLEENEPRILKAMLTEIKASLQNWLNEFRVKYNAVIDAARQIKDAWTPLQNSNDGVITTPQDLNTMMLDFFRKDPSHFRPGNNDDYGGEYNNYQTSFRFNQIFQQQNQSPTLKNKFIGDGYDLFKAVIELKRHLIAYDYAHLFSKISDASFVSGYFMTKRAKASVSSLLSATEIDAILTMDSPVVPALPASSASTVPVLAPPFPIPAPAVSTKDNVAPANTGIYSTRIKPIMDYYSQGQGQWNTLFRYKFNRIGDDGNVWIKAITRRIMCSAIEKIRTNKPFKTFEIPLAKYEPVNGVKTAPDNMDVPFNSLDWARYVNEIRMEPPKSKESKLADFGSGLSSELAATAWKVLPWESDKWSSDKDNSGQILFSEKKGNSYHFTDNGATVKRPNETRQDAVCKEIQSLLKDI